jgi:hypothetical protein
MTCELLDSSLDRWRAINRPKLVARVRASAIFRKRVLAGSSLQQEEAAG